MSGERDRLAAAAHQEAVAHDLTRKALQARTITRQVRQLTAQLAATQELAQQARLLASQVASKNEQHVAALQEQVTSAAGAFCQQGSSCTGGVSQQAGPSRAVAPSMTLAENTRRSALMPSPPIRLTSMSAVACAIWRTGWRRVVRL